MRSHVDDRLPNGFPLLSRDCPEYEVTTPLGNRLIVMINHLEERGGGAAASDAKRKAQAEHL